MNKPDAQTASVALLSITASVSIFGQLCPPLAEARKTIPGKNSPTYDVRAGEIAAVALALAIGITGSGLTGSKLPFLFSVMAVGAMLFTYEGMLRMTPKEMK